MKCFFSIKAISVIFFNHRKQNKNLLKSQHTYKIKPFTKLKQTKNIASEIKANKNYMLLKHTSPPQKKKETTK